MAHEPSPPRTLPVERLVLRNVRRRVRAWLAVFAIGIAMMPGLPILLAISRAAPPMQGFLAALAATIVAAIALATAGRKPHRRHWKQGRITLDQQGFLIETTNRRRRFAAHALQGGWVERDGIGARQEATAVLLFQGDARVHVKPASGTSAARFLSLAGVKASERAFVLQVPAASPGARGAIALALVLLSLIGIPVVLTAAVMLFFVITGVHVDPPSLIVIVMVAAALCSAMGGLAARMQITTLTVGTDGVLLRRLWRTFIPFDHLDAIDAIDNDVILRTTRGRKTSFRTASPDHALDVERQLRKALRVRVKRRREHRAALLAVLQRGHRAVHEWLGALRDLVPSATYRSIPVDPEELVQVVEDASAPKRVRVAAAYALAHHAHPEAKRRVRIAALGCADVATRTALETAAAGEESALRTT